MSHSEINRKKNFVHTGGAKRIYNVTIPKGDQLKSIISKEVVHSYDDMLKMYHKKLSSSISSSLKDSASSSSSSSSSVASVLDDISLPESVDLRSKFPPAFDQMDLGSCVANAFCGLISYDISPNYMGSRLFLYYNERKLTNEIPYDSGATLQDGVNSLRQYGVCPEFMWGYYPAKFAVKPTNGCYNEAKKHLAKKYAMLTNDITSLKTSLASGIPFVIGIAVYDSFESEQVSLNGMVPMPSPGEQLLGGHAVCVVGYADCLNCFLVRNSWGKNWGIAGYFWLPYDYVASTDLCSELFCVTQI